MLTSSTVEMYKLSALMKTDYWWFLSSFVLKKNNNVEDLLGFDNVLGIILKALSSFNPNIRMG